MTNKVKVFAHRGASGHAVENTFDAFNKAIHLKADGIETDIQCSRDGKLFIFHDINLRRLVGVNLFINDCSAEEISELKIGKRFFRKFTNMRIPTIDQFMDWLRINPISVNLELKESLLKQPTELVSWLINLELPEGSHFSSFNSELLQLVKQVRPDFETAILVNKKFDWNKLNELNYADAIHASTKYYNPTCLDLALNANKPMRFYGINGNETFIQNPHSVVVGWITDYPSKVLKAMGQK